MGKCYSTGQVGGICCRAKVPNGAAHCGRPRCLDRLKFIGSYRTYHSVTNPIPSSGDSGTVEEQPARQIVADAAVSRRNKGWRLLFLAGHLLCSDGLLLPLQVTIGFSLLLGCVLVRCFGGFVAHDFCLSSDGLLTCGL